MDNNTEIKQKDLLSIVIIVEGMIFVFAVIWAYFSKINPFGKIYFDISDIFYSLLFGLIILAINFFSINIISKYVYFFKKLKESYDDMSMIANNVNLWGALVIAIVSGFSEEFLFRGILQEQFGIIIASVFFGLFHIGNKKTFYYGIYAIFIGFLLGYFYLTTENLLVPIIVHVLNNFLALPYMRYYYRRYVKPAENKV